jgi:D-alanine transaminase
MPDIAFVNGAFLPFEDATVSIDDRGFQFGDGVYEVLRVYGGVPFRPAEHLARLERSARSLGIVLPFHVDRWTELITDALQRSGYHEAKIYIQVTRGVAPRDHSYSASLTPTVVVTVRSLVPPADGLYRNGVNVITVTDLRWGRCDIKCTSLLANVLAKQQAVNEGVFEALFVRDGCVLEGATSNVMMIQGGRLITPPEGPLLLSGVTRRVALQIADENGVSTEQRPIKETELHTAEEVFLTGTIIEILPVVRVNGRPIGTGTPGPKTSEFIARFQKLYA